MKSHQSLRAGLFGLVSIAAVALLISATGCGREVASSPSPVSASETVDVFVVNYPLAFFTKRIGGEHVEVGFPVPPDQNPALWEPNEDDVVRFQSADILFLNGADYAKWTLRTSLPWSRTVVTTRDVEDTYIEVPNVVTHTHGPEGEHSHAGISSETWLDPELSLAQARVVKDELQKLLPGAMDQLEANFEVLKKDLQRVDAEFKAAFQSSPLPWTASHPAFQYLGRRYDLKLKTMNWDPAATPSDEQWTNFEKLLDGAQSSLMLWTETPNPETLERLKQIGVRVIVFDLAANQHGPGDYLSIMNQNLSEINKVIAQQSPN